MKKINNNMEKSKLKIIPVVIIYLSLCGNMIYAQELPTIIPPDPISQEFQKFIGFPVSTATGTADINIPLYNLQLPGLNIPFSLKYHSSGIKVGQGDGIVGYGFSLFPGFKITRTIMGKPDDEFPTTQVEMPPVGTNKEIRDYLADISVPADEFDYSFLYDGQFDIFSIHLPTSNAAFILKWENNTLKAIAIPDAPIKITPLVDNINVFYGFDVEDDKGIRYIFGPESYSSTSEYIERDGDLKNITGWMLRKIVLPGVNNEVDFSYQHIGDSLMLPPHLFNMTIWDDYSFVAGSTDEEFYSTLGISDWQLTQQCNYAVTVVPRRGKVGTFLKSVKTVSFPNGRIEFSYALPEGSDFDYDLANIKVYNNLSNSSIKEIVFVKEDKLLKKISINGEGHYYFEYNPQRFNSRYDQDIWGYYNNKGNNPELLGSNVESRIQRHTHQIIKNFQSGSSEIVSITFGTLNRETDTTAMKANSLEKIIYPTGGYTRFFYEAHEFNYKGQTYYGGGLRVNKTESYDPVSEKTITKTYKYGLGESGLGIGVYYPDPDNFITEKYRYGIGKCRVRSLGFNSKFRYSGFNLPVWYDYVTEYTDGGKIIYHYAYTPDDIIYDSDIIRHDYGELNFHNNYEYIVEMKNLISGSPNLVKKQIFGKNGTEYVMLREIENTYTLNHSSLVSGLIVEPWASFYNFPYIYDWKSSSFSMYYGDEIVPFIYEPYNIHTGLNNLTSTIKRDFTASNTIIDTTEYTYDSNYPYNLLSREINTSNQGMIIENFYYPVGIQAPDLGQLTQSQQSMVTTLRESNYLTTMIEKETNKNSTLVEKQLFGYEDWGNSVYAPEQLYIKNASNPFESRLRYNNYDNKGNLTEVSKENDLKYSYFWSYKNTYPVVKAINANSTDLENAVNSAASEANLDTDTWSTDPSGTQWRTFNLSLRNRLPNAQVSTYTYKPLVGMTSQTDLAGRTTYYEYDDLGRLERIKDKDGNIVEEYKYNYGTPFSPNSLSFPQTGGTQNLTVYTDESWTITNLPSFISSVSPSSGTGESTVAVTCSVNSGTVARAGAMTFTYDGKTKTINISQEASLVTPSVAITSPTEGSYASLGNDYYLTINWNTNYEGNITIEIINNSIWYSFIQTFSSSVGNNSYDWYFVDDQGTTFEPGECVIMIYGDDSNVNDQVTFTLVE